MMDDDQTKIRSIIECLQIIGKFFAPLAGIANGGEREGKEKKERKKREEEREKRRKRDYFPQSLSPAVPKPLHFNHHVRFKAMHQLDIVRSYTMLYLTSIWHSFIWL
jgi:hypothetical protein